MSKSTTTSTPTLSDEQKQQIAAQTDFFTKTIKPTYENAVKGATDIYNKNAGGVLNAAQNWSGTAAQAQEALGGTGESALRTGISGLESLFNPDYEKNQIQAALQPAQAQYAQNIAGQQAGFGGAGNLGSARQALAGQQMAGANQALMANTAAQVQKDIAGQRMATGATLAQLGQGGIGQAIGAAGTQVQAAMTPQDFYNKYASIVFGTPQQSWNPDFSGTQGKTSSTSGFGIKSIGMPGGGSIGFS